SDGIRRQQAARPRHAPGVRRRHQRAGLHACAAVVRGTMGTGLPPDAGPGPALGAAPLGQGPGWAKLSAAVALRVPPEEIDTIYLFRPIKREGREWGTAVGRRRAPGGRRVVYPAGFMWVGRGKERGRSGAGGEEVALSPGEVVAKVMQHTADRTGDAEPPQACGAAVWYAR